MSTNPKTKAYWKRIARLAKRLRWERQTPYAAVVAYTDAGMPQQMLLKAIDSAIDDCLKAAKFHSERSSESSLKGDALKAYRVTIETVAGNTYQLVDGGNVIAFRKKASAP